MMDEELDGVNEGGCGELSTVIQNLPTNASRKLNGKPMRLEYG
jgi:hypothetical protein